ncbi:hypothetical protein D9619_011257 [Psilocybe cf. subviscida]|uniref:Uncharacterized protein n=1 Tax=Psilocybe cf. subviscida TaxID=2480587 RepID=A0A8H5F5F0_9AGAR|nr:hypothetical protein D9619_011257 [Psilocybe cf. subviscida]
MTSNFEETYVYDANGRRIEKHLFPNIKDSTVKKAIVLLGHEDEWDWDETVQTAFDGAQGMDISGGFFGIDADDEALEFGEEQLQAQMEEDRAQAATEMEILRTKNARLQAELDSARAGVWKVDNQAQVMALNAASTEYNNNYPSKRPSAQGTSNFEF